MASIRSKSPRSGQCDVVAGGPEVYILAGDGGGHQVGEEVGGAGEGWDAEFREADEETTTASGGPVITCPYSASTIVPGEWEIDEH